MKNQDEIWQAIKIQKKQDSDLNESKSEKENLPKRTNVLEEWNNQYRRTKQIIQKSEEQQTKKDYALEIRKIRSDYEKQIETLKQSHQNEIKKMKDYYEAQIKSRDEDIENISLLLNDQQQESKYDQQLNQIKQEFEEEIKNDRIIYKKQLETYIEEKIILENQIQIKDEEIQMLMGQINQMKEQLNSGRMKVSQNCAMNLFRDTNLQLKIKKDKLPNELDMTNVEDEVCRQVFYNSIKNFGQNIKLMDKSITHEIK